MNKRQNSDRMSCTTHMESPWKWKWYFHLSLILVQYQVLTGHSSFHIHPSKIFLLGHYIWYFMKGNFNQHIHFFKMTVLKQSMTEDNHIGVLYSYIHISNRREYSAASRNCQRKNRGCLKTQVFNFYYLWLIVPGMCQAHCQLD